MSVNGSSKSQRNLWNKQLIIYYLDDKKEEENSSFSYFNLR